jgi:hypothetical protein
MHLQVDKGTLTPHLTDSLDAIASNGKFYALGSWPLLNCRSPLLADFVAEVI